MKKLFYFLVIVSALMAGLAKAQYSIRVVKDNIFIPWEIIYGPDGNIWFDQKNGYVCKMDPATGNTDTVYHEANTVIHGEGGMVGMALHPSFPDSPYIYIAYEYLQNTNYFERVSRYTYNGSTLTSQQVLVDSITGAQYHNGCRLLIVGDKLFITTGDATVGSNAQDLSSKNGKILRTNLDGSIPADNPLGAGSLIWCWGQRNAQGMVYANNILYSSMHGNTTDDEINIIQKGRNYGWPTVEGYCDQPSEMSFCTDSNVVEPIHAWTPTIAPCGIDYYHHNMFPAWQNSLLLCTLKDTTLHQLKLSPTYDSIISDTRMALHYGRLRDICISPDGRVYISTSNSNAAGTGPFIDKIIELYDSAAAVKTVSAEEDVKIYPNPANDLVYVELKNTSARSYTVANPIGQVVLSGRLLGGSIPLAGLAKGVYFLRISNERGQIYAGKILKD
ncbi:MAG: PQQ-dependent sugar dehydrogenase [Bacteroidetes bacterium]|nr:PQQ-dependent sugar dehydrogenase [Bacteroidota bacterium]